MEVKQEPVEVKLEEEEEEEDEQAEGFINLEDEGKWE